MQKHKDDRRTLYDWGNGHDWKTCKTVVIHSTSPIGNHYHKIKHERFMLVSGLGWKILDGERTQFVTGTVVDIPPLMKHTFKLAKGSILIGLATEQFNPDDDYE